MPKGAPKNGTRVSHISPERRAKLSKTHAERMEFVQWKKYFGLPKIDPDDKETKLRRDYIRWFLRLDFRELYYLYRVAPKLLKGTPVAPYEPRLKRRRPKNTVEGDDGSTITEL